PVRRDDAVARGRRRSADGHLPPLDGDRDAVVDGGHAGARHARGLRRPRSADRGAAGRPGRRGPRGAAPRPRLRGGHAVGGRLPAGDRQLTATAVFGWCAWRASTVSPTIVRTRPAKPTAPPATPSRRCSPRRTIPTVEAAIGSTIVHVASGAPSPPSR